MKYGFIKSILPFLFLSCLAQAQDIKVKMVAYKDCHSDLEQLDFSNKPQQCHMSSQAITFMVEGQNTAILDKNSLKFSKLDVGGKDLRYNRKGENAFEFGSFPKVDDDGNYAIFDVNLKSAPFGYIGSASLDGTLDVITSEQLIVEEKSGLNLGEKFTLKIGPLTLSNTPQPKKEQSGALNEAGQALSKGLQTAFLGDDSSSLSIYVGGTLDALVSLEVYENGQKLNPGWSMTSDIEKKMTFSKPHGSVIDITLKYWQGLQRITVPIKL